MLGRFTADIRAVLQREEGFTMITVLGAMLVVMLGSAVAIAAATSDLGGGARDKATKQALSAAEAGVNDYSYHLALNNNYWALCAGVPPPAKVNLANASNMQWRDLPGTNASYAIEVLPANGKPACSTADTSGTMIDSSTGTFRIRVTGRVPTGKDAAGATTYNKRTLVTTYRRKGFLDFLYFTDYETSDPAWYKLDTAGRPHAQVHLGPVDLPGLGGLDVRDLLPRRAARRCRGPVRSTTPGSNWASKYGRCSEIQFADNDEVKGPLHTNDSLLVCGYTDVRTHESGPDRGRVPDQLASAVRGAPPAPVPPQLRRDPPPRRRPPRAPQQQQRAEDDRTCRATRSPAPPRSF